MILKSHRLSWSQAPEGLVDLRCAIEIKGKGLVSTILKGAGSDSRGMLLGSSMRTRALRFSGSDSVAATALRG